MTNQPTSLKINGKRFAEAELIQFADCMIRAESVPGWQKKIYLFIQQWLEDTPTLEARTSGSTGPPKHIRIEKAAMIKSAKRTGAFLNLQPDGRALLCLPIDFIAGKMMVVRAFVLGLDLIPVNPDSNPLKAEDEAYAFAAMTPLQVYHTLASTDGIKKLNRIDKLIIGGGEVDPALLRRIQKLENQSYHTYGMTETLTHVAMRRITGEGPETEFHTLPGVTVEVDPNGCLVIRDPLLGLDNLVTRDLAELRSETSFNFLGRADHVINTGGVKVVPESIENRLKTQIPNRLVVLGEKDEALGEKVTLLIETGNLGFPDNLERRISRAGLEKYEIPKSIKKIKYFPESPSGKIIRKHLLDMAGRE